MIVVLEDKQELFDHVKKVRKALVPKITQAEAAAKAKISPAYWARIEQGKANPSIEEMDKVFLAMGYKLSYSLQPVPESPKLRR